MIGVVLGLGFQWWPNLKEPWQVLAFIFVYIDIVDYWMDYGPSLKRFPPKREIDVILDVSIMFALFLYIYTTQLSLIYFLSSFVLIKILDYFWLLSSKNEYHPSGSDKVYVDSWLALNLVEGFVTSGLVWASWTFNVSEINILAMFIVIRVAIRILASRKYKKIHFV